jgi:hypothetical protein
MSMKDPTNSIYLTYLRYFAKAGGNLVQAARMAEHDGADQRAQRIIKANVNAMGIANTDLTVTGAIGALVESLATFSAIQSIPFVAMPLNTHVEVSTVNATGYLRQEGFATALTSLSLTDKRLTPFWIMVVLVFTQDLARQAGPAAETFFNNEVRKTLGLLIDTEVLPRLVDGSTPVRVSDGLDPVSDFRALLAYVNSTGESNPYYVMDPATANDLSLYPSAAGPLLFNQFSPKGGVIAGVPARVSGAIQDRRIYALDASSIAVNIDTINFDMSTEATIQQVDNPTEDSLHAVGSTAVSMFQTNSVALRANVALGVERLRDTAVAIVENTTYGSPQT